MRWRDLDLPELLELDPDGGRISFAGERALLLDAVAMGLLRRELIDTVGAGAARCILTRFGYAHGWRTAKSLEGRVEWDSERQWERAGGRLHTLQGLVVVRPLEWRSEDGPEPLARCTWESSYEAEQHLSHLGPSEEPVCWTLCGFASGYLSYATQTEVLCRERACVGCGDAACELVGRELSEWGDEVETERAYYDAAAVESALEGAARALRDAENELGRRRRELARLDDFGDSGFVANSPAMRRVLELAQRIARVDSTALVTGESGVGKERVARWIHRSSRRRDRAFVAINCGAVTETLLESELFGHVRGAFTGASQDRQGVFEAAEGGTLLLDEIGETSPAMQVKLLRVLQEREIRRVGESRSRPVDVRILAATHRDLAAEIAAGRFREDLYYRLRVVEIAVPPLRERREDLLELARELLARSAERLQRRVLGFTPEAASRLRAYRWPGNVRELENAVEHAVILCHDTRIDVEDLPAELRTAAVATPDAAGAVTLAEVERRHIAAVLARHQGHRERTARELGIGTATLYRKLKKYGLGVESSSLDNVTRRV